MYEHINHPELVPKEGEVLIEAEPIDNRRTEMGLCVVPEWLFKEEELMPTYYMVNYPPGSHLWEFSDKFRFKRIIKRYDKGKTDN